MIFLYFFSFYRKILPWVIFKWMKELWMCSTPNLACPCLCEHRSWCSSLGPLWNLIDITLHPRQASLYCRGSWFCLSLLHCPLFLVHFPYPSSIFRLFNVGITPKNDCWVCSISRGQWLARVALCRAPSTSTIKIKIVSFSQRGMFPNQVHSVSKKLDRFVEQIILI